MKPSLWKRLTSNCQGDEVNSIKSELDHQSIIEKLGRTGGLLIALGNFLWMLGLIFCVQAFLNANNSKLLGVLDSTFIWKALKLELNFTQVELSLFASAVAYSISALVHLTHLLMQLTSSKVSKLVNGGVYEKV
jgi:hypothetical protein